MTGNRISRGVVVIWDRREIVVLLFLGDNNAMVQEYVVLGCWIVLQGAGVSRRIVTVSSCQGCCTCNNGFEVLGRDFQAFVVLRDSIFLSGLLLLQQRIRICEVSGLVVTVCSVSWLFMTVSPF